EEICTLVIAEVFSEDSGSFTCTASNKYGTVSSIARLTVKASEDSSNAATLHTMSSINITAAEHQLPSHHIVNQTPKPKLEGVLVNHNEPRSSSKIGLRVHFKLPEEDKGSESSLEDGPGTTNQSRPNYFPERINGQPMKIPEPTSPSKEPPPVLAKPKLDQTQLKQLQNQVLLEQQLHHTATGELSFNMALLNSATSFHQQSTSTMYKQSQVSASQASSFSRQKQLPPSQTTLPTSSSSSSSVATFSNIPQGTQRRNHMENFTGNPPLAQSRSSAEFTSKNEQSLPSPKESVVPPLTLPTSAKQFQPQSVIPAPLSPTGRIQNPVAFLSAVLPSLPTVPATNAMGLPRSTPTTPTQGLTKKNLKPLLLATDDSIRENKAALVKDLERKLRF
ncbi:MYPN protein, partial [Oreotrochilus melanogaster]|nr:MYPN protein [Oreotrochilus melanogaster]